jgi:hypothetical protein
MYPPTSFIPHISSPLEMVPYWNRLDDDFLLSMFGFVNKYLQQMVAWFYFMRIPLEFLEH